MSLINKDSLQHFRFHLRFVGTFSYLPLAINKFITRRKLKIFREGGQNYFPFIKYLFAGYILRKIHNERDKSICEIISYVRKKFTRNYFLFIEQKKT